ncbi:hypothetical protein D3C84_928870 [compost metagenome]
MLGDDGDAGVRSLAALGHRRITTEGQAGQTALTGFDQLAIDVQLVGTIGLAAEHAGERVRRRVVGDIENAHVHRRQQHMHLLRHAAVGIAGLDLDRQRLLGTHLFRRAEGHRQLAFGTVQR